MNRCGEIFHFYVSSHALRFRAMSESRAEKARVLTLNVRPRGNREAIKPAELIQVTGHHELTLNARRAITILWYNAHMQGVEGGSDYTIEIEDLKPEGHKGNEMVEEAIDALMRTILTVRLPDGRRGASSSSAATTSTIRTGRPAC